MGINGLLPLLKDAQEDIHISKYKGKVLGVDAYVWLHRGAYGCAQQLALGQPTKGYVNFAMSRVNLLKHYGVTPYIVLDGGYLPAKAGTDQERARRRSDNLQQARRHMAEGRMKQARDFFVKCIDVTPAMAYEFIKALRVAGVDYIVAPYEADAQLAYLERRGTIQGIITEDSDLLVFGCKTVLYKLDDQGRCVEICHANRSKCKGMQPGIFSDAQFRQMAILSGCDYLDSVPGMGLKTAYRLLKQCGTVARALAAARMEGMSVPATYQQDFEKAERTFVYQRVFHRSSGLSAQTRMVTLNACDGLDGVETEDCIGPLLSDDLVEAVSRGDVDPITHKRIAGLAQTLPPHRLDRSKSMNTAGAAAAATSSSARSRWNRETQSTGQKTLHTFFSRSSMTVEATTTAASARKPLSSVTNVSIAATSNAIRPLEVFTEKSPKGKSRYFESESQQSSPLLAGEGFDSAELARFTPTQKRKDVPRCMSSDSGEISSPASSAKKTGVWRLQHSSPLVDEDIEHSSPSTSPVNYRPRTGVVSTKDIIQQYKSPLLDNESDFEDDQTALTKNASYFQQFAFQQTPTASTRSKRMMNKSGSLGSEGKMKANGSTSRSTSGSKRSASAFLRFEEEDGGDESAEATPVLKRRHTDTVRLL